MNFKSVDFNSCSWPVVVVLTNVENNIGQNAPSPSALPGGAKYVWATDAGKFDIAFFRLVVVVDVRNIITLMPGSHYILVVWLSLAILRSSYAYPVYIATTIQEEKLDNLT